MSAQRWIRARYRAARSEWRYINIAGKKRPASRRNAVHLRQSSVEREPVARGFIPVGLRSGPLRPFRQTELSGFTTASQPNGDKSPRHK
ncbi:hypothetical protein EYC95_02565 [Pseudomonas sp. BGI-2]|nr:hypothetical protein EYC95_02565 [Pseudomonas sp. BGI-2]